MTDDLADWLLEQIEQKITELDDPSIPEAHSVVEGKDGPTITYWSKREALADLEAKRQVVAAVQRALDGHTGPCTNEDNPWTDCELHPEWMETALKPYALRLLALSFVDRPGYREDWRP